MEGIITEIEAEITRLQATGRRWPLLLRPPGLLRLGSRTFCEVQERQTRCEPFGDAPRGAQPVFKQEANSELTPRHSIPSPAEVESLPHPRLSSPDVPVR
jgi:hypothetical protein